MVARDRGYGRSDFGHQPIVENHKKNHGKGSSVDLICNKRGKIDVGLEFAPAESGGPQQEPWQGGRPRLDPRQAWQDAGLEFAPRRWRTTRRTTARGPPVDRTVLRRRRERVRRSTRAAWTSRADRGACTAARDQRLGRDRFGDGARATVGSFRVGRRGREAHPSTRARRMRKPQPHAGPQDVPIRKSILLLLESGWEDWPKTSPAMQIRPLTAEGRRIYVVLYGVELGAVDNPEADDRFADLEANRERRWQALYRENSSRLFGGNLGHASTATMLRAMRLSRASETAVGATRLFRCPDCPRNRAAPLRPIASCPWPRRSTCRSAWTFSRGRI